EAPAVKRVADQGVPDMGEVDAHLMGAAGLKRAFDERGERPLAAFAVAEGLEHAPMSHSFASLPGMHGHLGAARGMAADRSIDDALRPRRRAPDEREIAALERPGAAVVGELLGERAMGLVGLGDHHEPARVLVEAMDDAGPDHSADARERFPAM